MREHTLKSNNTVVLDNSVNNLGDVPVLVTGLDGSKSGLSGVPSTSDDISDTARDLTTNDNSISNRSSVTVNLSTKSNLDNVTGLQGDLGLGIRGRGRKVSNNVVGRDGSRESNTLADLLALVNVLSLGQNKLVTLDTDVNDLSSLNGQSLDLLKNTVGDFTSSLVLGQDVGVGNSSID